MQEERFTKKDWTLFKNKIVDWQEAYMDKLNKKYIEILRKDGSPSDKFWELEKRINRDKKKKGVCLEMKRSELIFYLVELLNEGVIRLEDLDEFSDGLKETVRLFYKR
ncbi:MAG: multidrug transporter [Eubacteriales bacterium]|nr:multidrug transporter [Eubacteriales bacterium]